MGAPGTARARARAALSREILDVARSQLATLGADRLSLRAVARELEMAPSGLYRYFASRDDLLTALIIGAYEALGDHGERALAGAHQDDHRAQWLAVCKSVRFWAVAHPQEFALIYGSPVPDYQATAATVASSARVYTLLLHILANGARAGQLVAAQDEPPLRTCLAEDVTALLSNLDAADLAPEVLLRAVAAWTQLLGAISQELFGHLEGGFGNKAELFDYNLEFMADVVGLLPTPRPGRDR